MKRTTVANPPLWHYTCAHHREQIGNAGVLYATRELAPDAWPYTVGPTRVTGMLIWLTDLDAPIRDALGLTSQALDCDRGAHRYRVIDPQQAGVHRWTDVRRHVPSTVVDAIETATPGLMPAHWWVSSEPVHVALTDVR